MLRSTFPASSTPSPRLGCQVKPFLKSPRGRRGARGASEPRHARQAVTLIELMIVVVIMVMLLSVAIPLIQFGFQGKKVREAARQLNAYAALAKARAAEQNRDVGLYFERTFDNVNESLTVFLAEVPPPYAGDLAGARAFVRRNPNLPAPYQGRWEIVFDMASCATLRASRATMQIGDHHLIRFNHRGVLYPFTRVQVTNNSTADTDVFIIESLPTGQPPMGCWLQYDGGWGVFNNDDDGDTFVDELDEMGWPINNNPAPADAINTMNNQGDYPVGLPFQVFREPRRLTAAPLEMPGGTAVDLSYSGMGAAGVDFDVWRPSPQFMQAGPVIVMFSPAGNVSRVYSQGTFTEPTGSIHFLIGRNDRIQRIMGNTNSTSNVNPRDGNDLNIEDPDSLWVSFGPITGTVTTAENGWDPTVSALLAIPTARQFARSAQSVGGRGG